ncbi:MAG: hypothetical protein V1859_08145 [archaeon]
MELKSEGECKYCKKLVSGRAMSRHLKSCTERKKQAENKANANEDIFLVKASQFPFFVYFEVNANATLDTIDEFLRELWLECCGHLSTFNINGTY